MRMCVLCLLAGRGIQLHLIKGSLRRLKSLLKEVAPPAAAQVVQYCCGRLGFVQGPGKKS